MVAASTKNGYFKVDLADGFCYDGDSSVGCRQHCRSSLAPGGVKAVYWLRRWFATEGDQSSHSIVSFKHSNLHGKFHPN